MSWKIVPDSAADVQPDYKPKGDIIIEEVPLTITVDEKDYIDNHDLNTRELVDAFTNSENATRSTCPSPNAFQEAFEDEEADKIIAVTLSHNLSGSYNAAQVAKQMVQEKFPEKEIHIVDSYATGGTELLIVLKAEELINEGKNFDQVVKELEAYKGNLETLYTLGRYGNLIKNGRLNKIIGTMIQKFNIRIVGKETDGKLDLLYKVRGEAKAIKKLVNEMGELKDMTGVKVVIIDVLNKAGATVTQHLIEKTYPEVGEIIHISAGGLNAYYGEEDGLIVSF